MEKDEPRDSHILGAENVAAIAQNVGRERQVSWWARGWCDRSVVLDLVGVVLLPRGHWPRLETFFVVTIGEGGVGVLLASNR